MYNELLAVVQNLGKQKTERSQSPEDSSEIKSWPW